LAACLFCLALGGEGLEDPFGDLPRGELFPSAGLQEGKDCLAQIQLLACHIKSCSAMEAAAWLSPLKIDRPCRTVNCRQRRAAMVSGFGRRGRAPQSESKGEWLGQFNDNPGCSPPDA